MLLQALRSLYQNPKLSILLKTPSSAQLQDGDKFTVNSSYVSKRRRLAVPFEEGEEKNNEEAMEAVKRVLEDRKYQIDASVVRIMKIKNQLSRAELLQELARSIGFTITPELVMTRVENLIDRDYITRDPDKRDIFIYVK